MASRFDQWVGTAPIKLPIDTYRTVAMVNEQKTQQAIDNIGQTMAAYDQITPFGADATAVYDQNMKSLRDQVTAAAKMDLKTPDAKRRINQIIRDPTITRNLKNVMSDSILAQQKMQELNEYLKKNPDVNTYEYNRALGMVGRETGDASKFNPNRFRNLGPLVEYTDVDKMIREQVDKLKANETETREILGYYYKDSKNKELDEGRIRAHVAKQLGNNPLVSEQVRRSLENTIYRADPYDRNAGIQKLASTYRDAGAQKLVEYQDKIVKEIDRVSKGKSKKDLAKDVYYADLQEQLKTSKETQDAYINPNSDAYIDDQNMIQSTYTNAFVNGFNEMAYRETSNKLSYNEWAKSQWDLANKMKVAKYKVDQAKKLLAPPPGATPGVYDLPETQQDPSTHTLRGDIGKIPGLEGISKQIDDYGGVSFNDYSNMPGAFGSMPGTGDTGGVRGGVAGPMGSKGNTARKIIPGPMGGSLAGGNAGAKDQGVGPMGSGSQAPAPKSAVKKRTPQEVKTEITNTLKAYLEDHSMGMTPYNNFETEKDVRKALEDIQKYSTNAQRTYGRTYRTMQSGTDESRQSFMTSATTAGMFKNDGTQASKEEVMAMNEFMNKFKPDITNTPTLLNKQNGPDKDRSFFTARGPNNEVYHVYMDRDNNRFMGPVRATVQQGMGDRKGYVIDNSNHSMNVVEMRPGGEAKAFNVPLAATEAYQSTAKQWWDHNLKAVMGLGFNATDAARMLNSNYNELHNSLEIANPTGSENKPAVLHTTKGDVEIRTAIKYRKNPQNPGEIMYYSEQPLLNAQYPFLNRNGSMPDLNDYLMKGIKSFQSVEDNPAQYNNSTNYLQKKTQEAAILQLVNPFGGDD